MEREMICIPLEEYKALLRTQGEARVYQMYLNKTLKLFKKKYVKYYT